MKWSFRIGRLAGIDVFVHATFLLLLAFIAVRGYQRESTLAAVLGGVLFIVAIFAIVVLHELGHALAARRYGIPTRDITLLPIGGVARLERMPRDPRQELVIALAGPAVNVVLGLVIWGVLEATGLSTRAESPLVGGAGFALAAFLGSMLWVNVVLAVFNMIPAFPMDGGRVLRALIAMRRPYVQATEIAARVGRLFAILFAIVGIFGIPGVVQPNPFLVFIALFIWLGASGEAAAERQTVTLGGVPVSRVMITDFRALSPEDALSRAVDQVLTGFQQDFPVLDHQGRLVGLLTRAALIRALGGGGPASIVHDAMSREFAVVDPETGVEAVMATLRAGPVRTLPVVQHGRLVGLLTLENVSEYIMVETALRGGTPV